jgi:hypothetical protein
MPPKIVKEPDKSTKSQRKTPQISPKLKPLQEKFEGLKGGATLAANGQKNGGRNKERGNPKFSSPATDKSTGDTAEVSG